MKSCSICASTIDQCVHTSIAPCHALTQPCYALPCLDPNVLRLAKPPLGVPSISKYASLVRPDAQIVALRMHCARTALKAPPMSQTGLLVVATGKGNCSLSGRCPAGGALE